MPYNTVDELPDYIKKMPASTQRQFMAVFNSAHKNCMSAKVGGGAGDAKACEAVAFRMANGVVKKAKKDLESRFEIPSEFEFAENLELGDKEVEGEKCDAPCAETKCPQYGGATSFAEVDGWSNAQSETSKITGQAYMFRAIIDNIMEDEDLSLAEKSARIAKAASELPDRVANPPEYKELGEGEKASKTEGGESFSASDYAYVPEPDKPSTWKIRLTESPGKMTVAQVARAITALQPGGFRGNEAQIPAGDRAGVKSKISAAIGKIPGADDTQKKGLHDRLDAVKELAEEEKVGKRVQSAWILKLKSLLGSMKDFVTWAEYEDAQPADQTAKAEETIIEEGEAQFEDEAVGFKVYWDEKSNLPRWLAKSSNAFKDKHEEIFRTNALEEAVDHADKSEDRGPLLFFHVPGAQVGSCDFQAVIGRFLVESGTFDDTELGRKMVGYLNDHPEDVFGISIGYKYDRQDREDGIYDWLRITERSLTPPGAQANPWCELVASSKEIDMSLTDTKKAALIEVFGEERAGSIIASAESQTKELEEQGVAFKEEEAVAEAAEIISEGTVSEEVVSEEAPAAVAEETPVKDELAERVGSLEEGIKGLTEKLTELTGLLGDLQKSEDDRIAEMLVPRRPVVSAVEKGGSKSESEAVAAVKAALGKAVENPIDPYVDDLKGILPIPQSG